jgi:RNA polymerase subunit RPABC4/transcription elongation factor Spt4
MCHNSYCNKCERITGHHDSECLLCTTKEIVANKKKEITFISLQKRIEKLENIVKKLIR